jgi:hypothetical protein
LGGAGYFGYKNEKLIIYDPHFGGKKGEERHEQQQLGKLLQTQQFDSITKSTMKPHFMPSHHTF